MLQAKPAPEPDLLGEQTAGSLFRNIVHLYRRHFVPIVMTFFLPTFPFMLAELLLRSTSPWLSVVCLMLYNVASFIASGALTVTLSDIFLGNQPLLRRSFGCILSDGLWKRLLGTGVLVSLLVFGGSILLIVPGLYFIVRSLFTSTVVTLERRSGKDAIKRSFELTRQQFWRIAGLFFLVCAVAYALVVVLVGMIAGAAVALSGAPAGADQVIEMIANALVLGIFVPVLSLAMVLLYYDQRARREAYDTHALFEDLMR